MYKNISYIIFFLLVFSAVGASAQQLDGKWKLTGVDLEKRDFWNNNVTAKWSVGADSINGLKVLVYSSLVFSDSTCITERNSSHSAWTFSATHAELVLVSRNIGVDSPFVPVRVSYNFEFKNQSMLLGPIIVSYMENSSATPAKIAYWCRYELNK